jgi:hypothetical protein
MIAAHARLTEAKAITNVLSKIHLSTTNILKKKEIVT